MNHVAGGSSSTTVSLAVPTWLASIIEQFDEQYLKNVAPFEALISAYSSIVKQEAAAADTSSGMEERLSLMRVELDEANAELQRYKKMAADVQGRMYLELLEKYKSLKLARNEWLKTQERNQTAIAALEAQLKALEKQQNTSVVLLEDRELELQRLQRQFQQQESTIEDCRVNIAVLEDELRNMQMELLITDDQLRQAQNT